ncbi:Uncharacterised protein [Cedecea neteri]|uniref:Integrase catalytic domain-containing protein n=1 Tax=Cedecea neteri TaxID=158822 RepID=A0A2X3JAP9_9ENTR|nr:Uncharacterised protein [Cedecea neteri]
MIYGTREEACSDIFDYIEMFYSGKHQHGSGDQMPHESTAICPPFFLMNIAAKRGSGRQLQIHLPCFTLSPSRMTFIAVLQR